MTATETEILDAGEGIEALIALGEEYDLPPALLDLLLLLDDAISDAVARPDRAAPAALS